MRPTISEFSFGYAVTEEITRQLRHVMIGAPIFPSLLEEGKEGGGYDLKIDKVGFPLFLQFKLSHRMVRKNSIEIKDHSLLTTPFFRIHLMPLKLSQQHNMLLELDNGSNEVYYVAPFFGDQSELNLHYSGKAVLNNSFFIKPIKIGNLPDNEDHHISLEKYSKTAYLFSNNPKTIEGISYSEKFLADVSVKLERERESVESKIENNIQRMLAIINERIQNKNNILLNQLYGIPPSIGMLTYLARYYFDCEVLLVIK